MVNSGSSANLILIQSLKNLKPELSSLEDLNSLYLMVSKISNLELKNQISRNKKQIYWLTASSAVDMFIKYRHYCLQWKLCWMKKFRYLVVKANHQVLPPRRHCNRS